MRKPAFGALLTGLFALAALAAPAGADGTSPPAITPVDGTLAISGHHTCALAANGTAWCWGGNPYGELGDGTSGTGRDVPAMPIGVSRAVEVAVGGSHSCALLANGTVQCWGDNRDHQLGNATAYVSLLPTSVVGLDHVVRIDAYAEQTCAIRSDATVWCWGTNSSGQLGDGTTSPTLVPVQVSGLTNVVDISVSSGHSCAVRTDGSIWCWGSNDMGQLGDGTTTRRLTPVQVVGITTAKRVAVGYLFSCAVLADGTGKCWGMNDHRQLGNDTWEPSSLPLTIAGISDAVRIAAGQSHVCALIADGSVLCWGNNEMGQLGIEHDGRNHEVPVSPTGVANVVALVARVSATCVLLTDGSLTCWGAWTLPANDPRFVRGDPGIGNDDFAAAQSITALPFSDGLDATGATLEATEPDPSCAGPDPGASIWYRYKSTAARLLTVDSTGPEVAIYKGASLGTLVEVGCGSSVDLDVEADASYWLQDFGELGVTSLSVHARAPTPNDDLADATTISALPFTDTVDMTTATLEPGEPIPSCSSLSSPPYSSIWYRYVSPIAQQLRVTWSGYWYPRIGVYDRGPGGQLVEMACNGNPDDPSDFFAENGHEYFFLVRSHGDSGLMTFNLGQVEVTDTIKPTVQIVINPTAGTPGYTNSPDVTYFLNANDPYPTSGLTAMAISGSPTGPWSWEALSQASRSWTFTEPDGPKHIYAIVRDAAGNVSSVGEGTVILDRVAPTGTVTINGGAQYTNSTAVTISAPATDSSPVEHIALSNDGVNWATTWYEPSKSWTLAGNQGMNIVYVKWWDAAGNWSEVASDAILDSTAPEVTAPDPEFVAGTRVNGGQVVMRVGWSGQDAVSGIADYQLNQRTDSGTWTNIPAGSGLQTLSADNRSVDRTLSPGHAYTYRVKATDNATNGSGWVTGRPLSLKKFQESSSQIHYQGKWAKTSASSSWGGASKRSVKVGASATFTFTGRSFAWVSTFGSDRGRAEVYVNGVLTATVDLYSAVLKPRSIAWAGNWDTSATRTITIRVLGTAGRPRVDIDALIAAQ